MCCTRSITQKSVVQCRQQSGAMRQRAAAAPRRCAAAPRAAPTPLLSSPLCSAPPHLSCCLCCLARFFLSFFLSALDGLPPAGAAWPFSCAMLPLLLKRLSPSSRPERGDGTPPLQVLITPGKLLCWGGGSKGRGGRRGALLQKAADHFDQRGRGMLQAIYTEELKPYG